MEDKKVHLDDILSKFGLFTRYQLQATLLIGVVLFVNELHAVAFIFFAEDISYRCRIDQCESNVPVFKPLWYNFTSTQDNNKCFKYEPIVNIGCDPVNFNSTKLVPCQEWVYESGDTFVSELACQDWKRSLVGTVRSTGLMIGLLIQGLFSDRFGRKAAIILSAMAAATFGLAKSFSTSYWAFIVLELLEATFGDNCSPAYIMSIELVSSEIRLKHQIFVFFIFAMSGITLSVVAYSVSYWRYMIRGLYAPSFLFIFYYSLMDESVRWLLSKGKKEKTISLLRKMFEKNKIDIDDKILLCIQCEENETKASPLWDTFRSKTIMKRFMVSLIWWISCNFVSFGLIINVSSLPGNKYVNFALMAIFEIPSSIMMAYTLKRFKRKKPLFTSLMLAGLLFLIQPFVPKEIVWLSTGLYLVGRFLSTFTFLIVYMYTSELFPTYSRNSLLALCSSIGRIGSIVAPMTLLLTKYMESLPTLVIGIISLVAGLSMLCVPDISDHPLPNNVTEAEHIGLTKHKKRSTIV